MRALRIAAAILLTPILLFACFVQVSQHRLRHRAEQLNADLQPLMRRPATWEDLQRIQTRWGRYGHYEGTCNRDHCAYSILLNALPENLSPRSWTPTNHWDVPSWLVKLYLFSGGNAAFVEAHLRLTRNQLWGIHLTVFTGSETRLSFGNVLFAHLVFGPRLFTYGFGPQEVAARAVRDGYITNFPGFCTGCTGGFTSITPFTPVDRLDALTKINFSCLTRYIPCQAVDQILPAWNQQPYNAADWGDPHCLVPLDVRAREAANILLVQITGNQPNPDYGPNHWTTNVQILDRLKNAPDEHTGGRFDIAEMGAFLNPAPIPAPSETSPSPPLPTGTRYFVLYPEERPPYSPSPEPSTCSVTLATPENLALIQSGIAQDPSIGEPYFLPY